MGGLHFCEKKNIKINIKFSDKNTIDSLVQYGDFTCFLSCIYGEPSQVGRELVWERLSRWGVLRKEP